MTEIDMKSFKKVYENTPLHPGSGPLLAFKMTLLALQINQDAQKKKPKPEPAPFMIISGPAAEAAKPTQTVFTGALT